MKKVILYTFRSFPYLALFPEKEVFLFGKLKEDLTEFREIILKEKPDHILGFALVKSKSRFERVTINKFNNGVINKNSTDFYTLDYPENGFNTIKLSIKPTNSFCNWSMYKIANFLEYEGLMTKISFIHINKDGISDLISYSRLLTNK